MIILQVLGAILLAIIVIVVSIYLYFRFKFGKYLTCSDQEGEPLKIHLIEDIAPDWLDQKKPAQAVEALVNLGFQQGKSYTVDEMEAMAIQHFYKDEINVALYRHDIAGVWVDFAFYDDDGKEYTVSNVPEIGSQFEARPECIRHYDNKASIGQLYEKVKHLAQNTTAIGFAPDEFRDKVEEAYKKDMAFRVRNGGTSYDDFLKIAKLTKGAEKMSDKKLKEAFLEHKLQELNAWHYPALNEYAEKQNVDEDDDFTYECFIVPEKAHVPALLSYFEEQDFISEKQLEKLEKALADKPNASPYKVFEKINSLFSPERQAKLIATQDFPLPLRIYRRRYED